MTISFGDKIKRRGATLPAPGLLLNDEEKIKYSNPVFGIGKSIYGKIKNSSQERVVKLFFESISDQQAFYLDINQKDLSSYQTKIAPENRLGFTIVLLKSAPIGSQARFVIEIDGNRILEATLQKCGHKWPTTNNHLRVKGGLINPHYKTNEKYVLNFEKTPELEAAEALCEFSKKIVDLESESFSANMSEESEEDKTSEVFEVFELPKAPQAFKVWNAPGALLAPKAPNKPDFGSYFFSTHEFFSLTPKNVERSFTAQPYSQENRQVIRFNPINNPNFSPSFQTVLRSQSTPSAPSIRTFGTVPAQFSGEVPRQMNPPIYQESNFVPAQFSEQVPRQMNPPIYQESNFVPVQPSRQIPNQINASINESLINFQTLNKYENYFEKIRNTSSEDIRQKLINDIIFLRNKLGLPPRSF